MVSYHFRKWYSTPRMYILLLLMIFAEDIYLSAIREFSDMVKVPAAIFILPLLLVNSYFIMLILFGVIILFGNAPFMERAQLYRMVRAGRTKWALAQVIYIFFASFTYFIVLFVLSILLLVPYITWDNDWGKVYNTLAQTTDVNFLEILEYPISYHVILEYKPWEAVGLVILIGTLIGTLIGLLLFTGSVWISKSVGICFAAYIPISIISLQLSNGLLWYVTPGVWLDLEVTGWQVNRTSPTIPQAIAILIIVNLALAVLGIMRVKKMDIPVQQDV